MKGSIKQPIKVISFLGIGSYKKTCYIWKEQQKETELFPEGVAHFIQPTEMLICLTPTAHEGEKADNWTQLKQRFEHDQIPYKPLLIPEGHTEADLWQIFNVLTNAVDREERLVFDITHSFRSLPFLSFLAIAYLKTAKQVKVEHVLYGAFEAKDAQNRSPVFDLTPFVSLLDWSTATQHFIQSGNARFLSALLNPQGHKSKELQEASTDREIISQAARLCQPFTLMQEVGKLEEALDKAQSTIEVDAIPLGVLKNNIVETFTQFQSQSDSFCEETLRKEYQLLEWYYQKGQVIQAVSLGREWLIDAITFRLGEEVKFDTDHRKPFEEAISGIALVGKPHPQERHRKFTDKDLNRYGLQLMKWPEQDLLRQLWTDLKNVRNALDHAEHLPKKPKERTLKALQKLQEKMDRNIMPRLRQVAEE